METIEALREMAKHIATNLVAEQLKAMASGAVTVTVHAASAAGELSAPRPRLALPPKRRGRKPAPKPGPRKSKKWSAEQRAGFEAAMERRRQNKAVAANVPKRGSGRPSKPAVEPGRCAKCDHTKDEHDAQTGKCLSFRCGCTGFYA